MVKFKDRIGLLSVGLRNFVVWYDVFFRGIGSGVFVFGKIVDVFERVCICIDGRLFLLGFYFVICLYVFFIFFVNFY